MVNYHYEVEEYLADGLPAAKYFTHIEEFKGFNLGEIRRRAWLHFEERREGIEKRGGFFNLPFSLPVGYVPGENSLYSIWLFFVVTEFLGTEVVQTRHVLAGEEPETCREGLDIEREILKQYG